MPWPANVTHARRGSSGHPLWCHPQHRDLLRGQEKGRKGSFLPSSEGAKVVPAMITAASNQPRALIVAFPAFAVFVSHSQAPLPVLQLPWGTRLSTKACSRLGKGHSPDLQTAGSILKYPAQPFLTSHNTVG